MNNIELEKKIKNIIAELSDKKGFVSSVEVLMKLDYLSKSDYEQWRHGRVAYLEKVCKTNLSKLKTINNFVRQICIQNKYKLSETFYKKFGQGKHELKFSKSGNTNIERAYKTHYVNIYKVEKLNKEKKQADITPAGNSVLI